MSLWNKSQVTVSNRLFYTLECENIFIDKGHNVEVMDMDLTKM